MIMAFMCYFGAVVLVRARSEILEQERNSSWARELLLNKGANL